MAPRRSPHPGVCPLRHPGRRPSPATWTCSVENGVREFLCDACSREHLRAIEGRHDSSWW
ncbi:hypothetical protein AB0D38_43575 [Streptomyces sp. NPDC048279]|uniref:hypothetical protein n=1 Tax=Streptomyces sp. NPDC048279 TaxID=3154714 RepID=UPI00344549A4